MALTQARTMPGVMELLPVDQIAFQRMLDTIRRNFERFGFLPIETPVMEFSDVLLTKQGGETERQVYFVQSTGALEKGGEGLPELALRFDLTVPLARYVAEHEHELNFPFRRYQIQRVYRGERAQRGRFREFYQCDIDVIGKDQLSARYDAEMPAVIYSVFKALDFGPFTIRINNRKFLRGFMEAHDIAQGDEQALVLREIDKLEKAGVGVVHKNLQSLGLSADRAHNIIKLLADGPITRYRDVAATFANFETSVPSLLGNASYLEGKSELTQVFDLLPALGVPETAFGWDTTIARGLDYYTGTIYETTLDEHKAIGSVCSGGRYDNLATNYTKSHLPGVGISIGATRLFYQLREANLLKAAESTVKVLVTQMDDKHLTEYLDIASRLRSAGIATEVVLESAKLGKQFKYADRAGIRFVVVLGPDEIAKSIVTVKDMRQQDQFEVGRDDLVETLRRKIEETGAEHSGAIRQ